MMGRQKTYIGIDLGTADIGYAVTNENYKIEKVGRKNALGVYVYSDENMKANSAVDRRVFRGARRRIVRRRFRLSLLQELFAVEIAKKDANFLLRLRENDLRSDDRSVASSFSLFCDSNYTDKEFYRKYPTIYHLRKDIIDNGTDDIRKLYLAIHHIVKYRGNFLIEEEFDNNTDDENKLNNILPMLTELNEAIIARKGSLEKNCSEGEVLTDINLFAQIDLSKVCEVMAILLAPNLKKKERIEKFCTLLSVKDKALKKLINGIFGYKIDITAIFGASQYEKDIIKSFSFEDDYEEIDATLATTLSEEDYKIISLTKALYDTVLLITILKGKNSISDAMTELYNKHKSDLECLKGFIRKRAPNKYNDLFGLPINAKNEVEDNGNKDNKNNNYTKYIGGGRPNGKDKYCNGRLGITCGKTDFYTYVKKILEEIKVDANDTDKEYILAEIENGTFMPKVVSSNNGILPYQLNMLELEKILSKVRQDSNFAWLDSSDEYGSVADKIKELLRFRVPYYVGPLKMYRKENENKNAWAVRISEGRVTPWNFEKLVDTEKSSEQFIKKMLNKCTYLKDAYSLPMNSIMYSEFIALAELNKLKLNDTLLPISLKQEIWETIYVRGEATPTVKGIISFLRNKGYADIKLTGYDITIKGNLKSYHTLRNIIGDKVDANRKMAERLILLMTVHSESKILEHAIKNEFGGQLTAEEIKKLKGIRYSGWGRLSAEFLEGIEYDGLVLMDPQGERLSILSVMKDTTYGLMEIVEHKEISKFYQFDSALKEYNNEHGITINSDITYQDVEEMYCSPSVKRSVWQAFLLIKTLVKETKNVPSKIFIESTRGGDTIKQRTKTRQESLIEIYKKAQEDKDDIIKNAIIDFKKGLGDSNKLENINNSDLNPEKIYLYYLQLGKCAYSGEPINFDNLKDCDIDHIIPQAMIKDDSIDNKVLAYKKYNANKSAKYPVPVEYRQKALWKTLYNAKLMSKTKFDKLMRVEELTEEEKKGFINRQLVETSQMTLLLRDLLERQYNKDKKNIEIVLSKAGNVSDFRKEFGFTKSREFNDFHHAEDAYLNIVVGNVLHEKFIHNRDGDYINKEDTNSDATGANETDAETNKFLKTFFSSYYSIREKKFVWENKGNFPGTLNLIRNELNTTDFSVAKKTFVQKGELFKSTIFKANKYINKVKNSMKYTMQESLLDKNKRELHPKSNANEYGYRKVSGTAYFAVVDSDGKAGEIRRSIVEISIYENKKILNGKLTLLEVIADKGLVNARLAQIDGLNVPVLKMGELIVFNSAKMRLSGANEKTIFFHNANQLFASSTSNVCEKEKYFDIVRYVKELTTVNEKILKEIAVLKNEEKEKRAEEKFQILEADKERRIAANNNLKKYLVFVSQENNLKLYEFFADKINKKPYSALPGYSKTIDLINNAKGTFETFSVYKQMKVLLKLIVAFQCNACKVDTSDLFYMKDNKDIKKGSQGACSIALSKFIEGKDIKLIVQSKTGLKEKTIKLS